MRVQLSLGSFSVFDDSEINFAANRMARKEGAMGQELIIITVGHQRFRRAQAPVPLR